MTAGERTARAVVVAGLCVTAGGVWLLTGPGWGLVVIGVLGALAGLVAIDIDQ